MGEGFGVVGLGIIFNAVFSIPHAGCNKCKSIEHQLSFLAIAGDCFYLGDDYKPYDFIWRVADEFEAVCILPGNHEYYGGYGAAQEALENHKTDKKNNKTSVLFVKFVIILR